MSNPDIPADIAAAIDALDTEAQNCGVLGRTTLKHVEAHAALNTAILARLAAAEAARDAALRERDEGFVREEVLQGASSDAEYWTERALAAEAERDAALARAERLEGFIDFVLKWRDRGPPHGDPATAWNVVSHHPLVGERARARAALSPAPAEEAQP